MGKVNLAAGDVGPCHESDHCCAWGGKKELAPVEVAGGTTTTDASSQHHRAALRPGHTIAGISYMVPGAVFTGDTLFVGGCGRTDFPGGNPHVLWQSLSRLSALPDETRVYPGHNYGETPTSTIGWERATNPYLRCRTEEEFVALRTGKNPPRPPKLKR